MLECCAHSINLNSKCGLHNIHHMLALLFTCSGFTHPCSIAPCAVLMAGHEHWCNPIVPCISSLYAFASVCMIAARLSTICLSSPDKS